MILGLYSRNDALLDSARLVSMLDRMEKASCKLRRVAETADLQGIDMLLSIGGDGTFLSASKCVGGSGVPILGINLGRLGFLSEYSSEEACEALLSGKYELEERRLVKTSVEGTILDDAKGFWPYSLNEVCVHRTGAAILGIEVSIDGARLGRRPSGGDQFRFDGIFIVRRRSDLLSRLACADRRSGGAAQSQCETSGRA